MTTENTEGLGDFDDAVTAALAELEAEAAESETPADQPSDGPEAEGAEDQAKVEADEQSEESTESATQPEDTDEEDEIFADLITEEDVQEQAAPDLDSMTFDIPGEDEPKTLQELKEGYMRNADYTQKRQADAAKAQEHEQAIKLYEALTGDNAMAAVHRLAVDAGLIQQGQQPIADPDLSPFKTTDAVEAEIAKRVEAEVAKHPVVLEAQRVQVQKWMDDSFTSIEEKHSITLGPKSRREILLRASKAGTNDLEMVTQALLAEKQARASDAEDLRAAAPGRSSGRTTRTAPEEPDSLEEAFALAEVSHGVRG